jgi:hypothetical protein
VLDKAGKIDLFISKMNQMSMEAITNLNKLEIWKSIKTFVDIGGNNGFAASRICSTNPNLTGYVADLPCLQKHFDN